MKSAMRTLAFVAAGLLAGCSGSPDAADSAESLLRFLPEDTSGVAFADVAGLRENPFAGNLLEERAGAESPERYREFVEATGFDLTNDLRQVMVGSAGEGRGLIVVGAVYDRDRVSGYLTGEGMAYGDHEGTTLFRVNPDEERILAFVDDVALLGPESEVRNAIDRAGKSLPSALDNGQLLEDIAAIADGYQLWATGRVDSVLISDAIEAPGPADLLRSIETGTWQMRVDDMVTARAVAEFTSSDQAMTAASLLEGLRGIAMLQGRAGEYGELLSGIRIANNESRVEVHLQVDTAVLERLAESGALSP